MTLVRCNTRAIKGVDKFFKLGGGGGLVINKPSYPITVHPVGLLIKFASY